MSEIPNYEHIDFGKKKSIIKDHRKKKNDLYISFGVELTLIVLTSLLMGKADSVIEYIEVSFCAGVILWLKYRKENEITEEREKLQLQLNNDNYDLQTNNSNYVDINNRNKTHLFVNISKHLVEEIERICGVLEKNTIKLNIRVRFYWIDTNNDYILLSNYSTNPKYNNTLSIHRRYYHKDCTILNEGLLVESLKKHNKKKYKQEVDSNLKINDFSTYTLPIETGTRTHIIIIESDIVIKDYYNIFDLVMKTELKLISRVISNYEII